MECSKRTITGSWTVGDLTANHKLPSWTLFLAVCAVGIGGTFQYGYNVSIINAPTGHIHKFLNETWSSRYQMELNPSLLTLLWSVIASIFSLGGLCGAHIGGSMAIRLGRKGALLVNNFIAILASILMGISFPTGLFELLMVGRFLIGVNTGVGICVQPLYIGEVAPKHLRGAMAMGSSIFLTGGILTGQIIGLRELLGGEKYWPFLLSSSCFPALAQLFFLPWFPESPRYLLIDRGDEMKCTKALKCFHGPLHYQEEMEDIQRERFALNGEKPKKPWQLFGDRSVKWQLITVIVMTMGQQLSGINAGLLIDYMGRRLLIIGGYTLMSFWCIVLTFSLTYQELYPWVPYLSMASIFAFILSFGLGPGGITNTLTAELFTQSSRPAAYMIGGSVSWLSFFTIGMLFPFIVNGLKQYCFVVFLVESLLVACFIFFVIPETKNKSFLEIKREFQHLNFRERIKEKEAELCERRQLCNEC
ncbi:solute carrier family 2, facilitated glucose transporter member 11-like isoform X3 [Chrysemys picta bellii]|uniref:solute carrier family 2, facilitated glucose transporter member 11-like isoform X3 n=1 Tax=Chrysemys picta bellii TaxID=8478 RepID=UPI000CE63FCF